MKQNVVEARGLRRPMASNVTAGLGGKGGAWKRSRGRTRGAAHDAPRGHAYAADEPDESGGRVKVTAAAAEEVGEREGGSGSGEENDGDQHLAPFDQGDQIAEELREGLSGEAAIGAGRLHEGKREGRQQDARA